MGKLQGAEQSHSPATSVKCDRLCGSVVGPTRGCRSKEGTATKAVGTGSILSCEEGSDPKRSTSVPPQVGGQVQQRHLQVTFHVCRRQSSVQCRAGGRPIDVFVPTPTPESHSLLEVYALQNKWCTRSLDIVAAFLIGRDRGATEGKPVYVRAPVEWHDLFEEWLSTLPAGEKAKYKECFKEMYFRLDGNLYGRRTAGSVYRNELEAIICEKIDPQRYQFQRGVKDPCVFRCLKTGVILVHHVDDIRAAGPADVLADLFEKEFPKYCEVQAGELEKEGTAVEFLGRTKIRTKDAIVTVPDAKHRKAIIAAAGITAKDRSEVPSKQLDLMRVVAPLDDEKTKRFRSAVGSAIYLSADRRDIQYATKELARRMSAPRECDWTAVVTLASYLQSHPHVIRVISTDKQDDGPWEIESYTDSDWAGCLETRRSMTVMSFWFKAPS